MALGPFVLSVTFANYHSECLRSLYDTVLVCFDFRNRVNANWIQGKWVGDKFYSSFII